MTRAPQLRSMRSRVAGMLPPGSPATISRRTVLSPADAPALHARRSPPAAAHRSACSTRQSRRPTRSSPAGCCSTCRRPGRSAGRAGTRPRSRPRTRGTDRTKTERTRDRPASTRAPRIDRLPAVEHPLPALVRVDPAQWPAGRRRRLAVARVVLERFGQRGAPGRIRRLIRDQLRLRRQRQPPKSPGNRSAATSMPAASSLRV